MTFSSDKFINSQRKRENYETYERKRLNFFLDFLKNKEIMATLRIRFFSEKLPLTSN